MNDHVKHIASTWVVNAAVLATTHLSDIKEGLSCVLIAVTIFYTMWKWRRAAKRKGNS